MLEAALGVGLPAAFRAFLLRIGTGTGPYYGIYDAEPLIRSVGPECARPFPEGMEGPFWVDEDDEDGFLDGHLPIIEVGCGLYIGLVTNGAHRDPPRRDSLPPARPARADGQPREQHRYLRRRNGNACDPDALAAKRCAPAPASASAHRERIR